MSDGATPKTNFDYSALNPSDPATIQALIDFHRSEFGGFTMEGDEGAPAEKADPPESGKQETKTPPAEGKGEKASGGDEPLGEPGKKALEAEREAARQAKADLAKFQQAIAAAFGLEGDAKGTKPEDTIAALAEKVSKLERDAIVAKASAGITDADDLALIAKQPDEASMLALAARLRPATGAEAPQGPKSPKPDPSIGKQGGAKPTSLQDAISAHYNT